MCKFFIGNVECKDYDTELKRVVRRLGSDNVKLYQRIKLDVMKCKYRQMMGLSWEEFMKEPLGEMLKNVKIQNELSLYEKELNGKLN